MNEIKLYRIAGEAVTHRKAWLFLPARTKGSSS